MKQIEHYFKGGNEVFELPGSGLLPVEGETGKSCGDLVE